MGGTDHGSTGLWVAIAIILTYMYKSACISQMQQTLVICH